MTDLITQRLNKIWNPEDETLLWIYADVITLISSQSVNRLISYSKNKVLPSRNRLYGHLNEELYTICFLGERYVYLNEQAGQIDPVEETSAIRESELLLRRHQLSLKGKTLD